MNSDLPQLLISYDEAISESIANDIAVIIKNDNLTLIVEKRPGPGIQAGAKWFLLTAMAVFITKSYFDAFLKEMGKDHYHLLKKGLNTVWKKLFSKDRTVKCSILGTRGKIAKDNKYSMAFSLWSEIDERHRIKFLFEEELTQKEFEKRIDLMLALTKAINEGENTSEYILTTEGKPIGGTILIAYDKSSGKLCIIDPVPKKET